MYVQALAKTHQQSIVTRSVTTLKDTILEKVPEKQASLLKLKKEHGKEV